MKSYLFVCLLAAAFVATLGYKAQNLEDVYNEEALEALEGTRNELIDGPFAQEDSDIDPRQVISQNGSCNCDNECDKLHASRLPHVVRDVKNYLSYENYPVLCRDAASIMLPPNVKPQKKYICKQVFDCCRKCNHAFYLCLSGGNDYGLCMRKAYKCMCDCIDRESHQELPYKP